MKDVDFDELSALWCSIAPGDVHRIIGIARRVLRAPAAMLHSTVKDPEASRFSLGDQRFLPHAVSGACGSAGDRTAEITVNPALPVLASLDAPLVVSGYQAGILSVFDASSRQWSDDDRDTLVDLADCLSDLIALRHIANATGATRSTFKPSEPTLVHAESVQMPFGSGDLEEAEPEPGSGSHILLADDLDLNRKLICDMLSLEGHIVDSVADGASAVRAAGEHQYDLILMDMIMPGMDGVTATRAIRALPAPACEVPIVALTAHSLPEQLESCLQAGMDATLIKPMTMDALTSAVATWARMRRKAA